MRNRPDPTRAAERTTNLAGTLYLFALALLVRVIPDPHEVDRMLEILDGKEKEGEGRHR